ncbi:MAG: Omp28-related outer membrane protein [Bacteroidales bacterium]
MKKILYSLLLIIPLLWISCDTIEDDEKLAYPKGQTSQMTPITVRSSEQKVLLEDYTGWKCTNCPRAAAKATELISKYGESLVVMAVHATAFASPLSSNNNIDFRTEYGEKWVSDFEINGLPAGIINRKKIESSYVVIDANWDNNIENTLSTQNHIMNISLGVEYKQADNTILVSCENEFLESYSSPTLISILVLESGIIGVQRNSEELYGESPIILNFEFNHVLRKNGLVDYSLSLLPIEGGNIINKNYLLEVDPDIQDITKCSIVVFVTNAETKEVLQVNTVEL